MSPSRLKSRRNGIPSILAAATVFSAVLVGSCTVDYLNEAVGRATKQEVIQRLGQPTEEKHSFTYGGPLLIYGGRGPSGGYKNFAGSCNETRLSFDSNEILRDWVHIGGVWSYEKNQCVEKHRIEPSS